MAEQEGLSDQLRHLRRRAREQNYVDFFDLRGAWTPGDVQAAAANVRARLAALRQEAGGDPAVEAARAQAVAEVAQSVADAEAVLSCPVRGPRYAALQQNAGR